MGVPVLDAMSRYEDSLECEQRLSAILADACYFRSLTDTPSHQWASASANFEEFADIGGIRIQLQGMSLARKRELGKGEA